MRWNNILTVVKWIELMMLDAYVMVKLQTLGIRTLHMGNVYRPYRNELGLGLSEIWKNSVSNVRSADSR